MKTIKNNMNRHGFVGDDGKVYLQRCPKCEKENWAMAVATGECCWCGYKAKEEDIE